MKVWAWLHVDSGFAYAGIWRLWVLRGPLRSGSVTLVPGGDRLRCGGGMVWVSVGGSPTGYVLVFARHVRLP